MNKSDMLPAGIKPVDRRKPMEVKIVGVSQLMKKLLSQLSKVAGTEANVLITGENGTGKEVVARTLHKLSGRAGEVFVKVDIGSVSSSLFESELFGHKQGAFTDARHDREGRIEAAEKGTLFLDEIANIPLELQSKILSVLQNRQVYRIGTNTGIPVNIRLITATNMPLDKLVREGKFREDLLYRLNTITINIPPLRERKADISPLFYQFKENFEHKYAKVGLTVGAGVLELLEAWHWPGNVRELEHAVEKAVIMSENGVITVDEFSFRKNGDIILLGEPECFNLAKNEMRIIHQAIKSCKGNLSQASRVLGITRKTLYNKINKYGI
jgi:two-component system response regulator HydG